MESLTGGVAPMDARAKPVPQVQVFGGMGVVDADGPVSIGGPRQRRLLALLAIRSGSMVSVDWLVEYLWADHERPDATVPALRTYVSRLRSALPEHAQVWLETESGGYQLTAPAESVEHRRFASLRAEATRARELQDPLAAIGFLDEALSMWRGEPFVELEDLDWARAEIEQLGLDRLEMLEERWEASLALGRHTQITGELAVFTAEHRLRDRATRQFALALHRSGRTTEALRVISDHRRVLVEESGLDPSPGIVELETALLNGDPSLDVEKVGRPLRGYRLVEEIGSGAFSVVWRGTQPSVEREVAIKQIRSELAAQPEFIRRFEAEARLVARVEHPHIVPLIDFWRDPDSAYLVMRWLRGGTLERRLDDGPLSIEETLKLTRQIGGALAAAHAHGVVHRDVKAANILFDENDNAFLADFGIALEAVESAGPEAALSQGSPAYASPEQLRREPLGPQADIFSLGVVIFECLTGSLPFPRNESPQQLVDRQLNEPYPRLSECRADVPRSIVDAVATATEKNHGDRFDTVEEFLNAFDPAIVGAAEPESHPTIAADVENPYKGLRAFGDGDVDEFFGRDRLVAELLRRFSANSVGSRCLVVVGPSGSGKSSVVRAGLTPALRAGGVAGSSNWFVTTIVPGSDPLESLEAGLLRIAVNPPASLVEQMRDGSRGILRSVRRCLAHDDDRVLVVIDQFEEVFTGRSREDAHHFLDGLSAAVEDPTSPVRFVVTLRADYFHRALEHPTFSRIVDECAVNVTPLAADELEQAIVGPARRAGCEFEPGLVARIAAETIGQPSPLPLLQYTLSELFERREGNTLTIAAYDRIGGLTGALAASAEALYTSADDAERRAIRRVFGRLTTPDEASADLRRRVPLSDLGDDPTNTSVVQRFGDARLVTFDRDPATREPTVEVAHEALLREWPRLVEWLREDADVLRLADAVADAATTWDQSGRDGADLFRGGRLETAVDLSIVAPDRLRGVDSEFIAASRAASEDERDRERRGVRRLRGLLAGAAVALVLALIAGGIAVRRGNDANAAAKRAEVAALVSRSAEATDPTLGLLLALEANRREPGAETDAAILAALGGTTSGRRVATFPRLAEQTCGFEGYVSDDGLMQTSVANDILVMRDLTTGDLTEHGAIPEACAWWFGDVESNRRWARSETGDRLWLGPLDGPWETMIDTDVATNPFNIQTLGANRLVVEEREEANVALRLLDATTGVTVGRPLTGLTDPIDAASSPDGTIVALSAKEGRENSVVVVLDSETGGEVSRTEVARGVQELTVDEVARQVLLVTTSGGLVTIDIDSGAIVSEVDIGLSDVYGLDVRSDGLLTVISQASVTSGGKIELVDRERGVVAGSRLEVPELAGGRARSDELIDTWDASFRVDVLDLDGGAIVGNSWDVASSNVTEFGVDRVGFVLGEPSSEPDIEVLNLANGERERVMLTPPAGETASVLAAFPEDGGLLTVAPNNLVTRWRDGQVVERIEPFDDETLSAVGRGLTPDRIAMIAVDETTATRSSFSGQVALVDRTPGSLAALVAVDTVLTQAAFPAPGDGLYTIDLLGILRTYDATGAVVDEIDTGFLGAEGITGDVESGLLAVSSDKALIIVEPVTGEITTVPTFGFVSGADFVQGGANLVIRSNTGQLRLWDVNQRVSRGVLFEANEGITASWYDDLSQSLWLALESQVVELQLDPDAWVELACEAAGRTFTQDEWDLLVPGGGDVKTPCA